MRLFVIFALIVPTLVLTGLALPGIGTPTGVDAPAASSLDAPQTTTSDSCLECLAICIDTGDGACERACGCTLESVLQ